MDYKKLLVDKVVELDVAHDFGLQKNELKYVVAKLETQKVRNESDDEWAAAVESIVHSYRNDPLTAEMRRTAVAVNQICPICQITCEPITLTGSRKAWYCKAHKVVLPALAE